jgi:hypothetical protein
MKRVLLKSVAALMVACMFVLMSGGVTAIENEEEFTEIIIEGVDCCEKKQQIIATINGENLISPMSLFCIFGHSLAETRVIEINHRFWSTSPRCRETVHRVVYCTRSSCNHMVLTQISQRAIPCC